jgi:hypothetical protein
MGAQTSSDIAYGVAIDLESTTVKWWDLPEQGDVVRMGVGQYGGHKDPYLIISDTFASLESGEARVMQPYRAADEPYVTYDAMLVAAAEELKVPVTDQPGWIFAVDES